MLRKMFFAGTLTASFTAGWKVKAWYDEKMGPARPSTIVAKVSKLWDGVTKGDPKDRQIRELRDKVREKDRALAGCRAKYEELSDAYIVSLKSSSNPHEDRNHPKINDRGSSSDQHDDDKSLRTIKRSDDDRSNRHEIYDLPPPPPQRRP